jgi:hypothetical protein
MIVRRDYGKAFLEFLRRYGLAASCIIGPLLFGLGSDYLATKWLVPFADPEILSGGYLPAIPPCRQNSDADNGLNSQSKAGAIAPVSAPKSTGPTQVSDALSCTSLAQAAAARPWDNRNDPLSIVEFWSVGQQYSGRLTYAIASAFLYLIAAAVLIFGVSVVAWEFGVAWACSAMAFFLVLAVICGNSGFLPRGRTLIVEGILNKADGFFPFLDFIGSETGERTRLLVQFNTVISFFAIGMLLSALYVLSVQPKDNVLTPTLLRRRLTLLRLALALGSAFLVIGVLAQKILMDWPLSLIVGVQANGLRSLANALTLQVGAQGTMGLFAAFGPAIAAWSLDATALRRKTPAVRDAQRPKSHSHLDKATEPRTGMPQASNETFAFAPLASIVSFLGLLAPLLASPFIDALKSIFSVFASGTP